MVVKVGGSSVEAFQRRLVSASTANVKDRPPSVLQAARRSFQDDHHLRLQDFKAEHRFTLSGPVTHTNDGAWESLKGALNMCHLGL